MRHFLDTHKRNASYKICRHDFKSFRDSLVLAIPKSKSQVWLAAMLIVFSV